MSRPKAELHRITAGAVLLAAVATRTYAAVKTLPLHREWNAVPVPAEVAIDGSLSEWDTSAGMYIHGGTDAEFASRAVCAYAMYDAENLYKGSSSTNTGWAPC